MLLGLGLLLPTSSSPSGLWKFSIYPCNNIGMNFLQVFSLYNTTWMSLWSSENIKKILCDWARNKKFASPSSQFFPQFQVPCSVGLLVHIDVVFIYIKQPRGKYSHIPFNYWNEILAIILTYLSTLFFDQWWVNFSLNCLQNSTFNFLGCIFQLRYYGNVLMPTSYIHLCIFTHGLLSSTLLLVVSIGLQSTSWYLLHFLLWFLQLLLYFVLFFLFCATIVHIDLS